MTYRCSYTCFEKFVVFLSLRAEISDRLYQALDYVIVSMYIHAI